MDTPYCFPSTKPAPVPSPDTVTDHDIFQSSSPPLTPRAQPLREHPSDIGSRGRPAQRDTSLDHVASAQQDGEKDPHDLAFSPKHVTRASVVDNMVMALDQFSGPTSSIPTASRDHRSAAQRYTSSDPRRRGNTISSEVSSHNESRFDQEILLQSFPRGRGVVSNSTTSNPRSLQPISGRCEDEDSTSRHRVYESQRAHPPRHRTHGTGSGKTSNSSSVDLGHVLAAGDLDLPGSRRSQSFDLGSNRHQFLASGHEVNLDHAYDMFDHIEAAPTPIVHAGPSRGHSPIRQFSSAPLSPLVDQSLTSGYSVKSSKTHNIRKARARTIEAANSKGRDELRNLHEKRENLHQMPTLLPSSNRSPFPTCARESSRTGQSDLPPPQPTKDRPGLLRRVFGSKNASTMSLPHPEPEGRNWREPTKQSTTEEDSYCAGASSTPLPKLPVEDEDPINLASPPPKEPQTLTKKSSAFFRRRQKSMSGAMPPPLQLSQKTVNVEAEGSSPVSSLRQVMDPYLANPSLPSPPLELGRGGGSRPGLHAAHTGLSHRQSPSQFTEDSVLSLSDRPGYPDSHPPTLKMQGHPDLGAFQLQNQEHQDSTTVVEHNSTADQADSKSRPPSPSGPFFPRRTSLGPGTDRSSPLNFPLMPSSRSGTATASKGSGSPQRPTIAPAPTSSTSSAPPSKLTLQRQASDHLRGGRASNDHLSSVAGSSASPSGSELGVCNPTPSPIVPISPTANKSNAPSPSIKIVQSPEQVDGEKTSDEDHEQALKIFENRDETLDPAEASAWLGEAGNARERIRMAYMRLFDWTSADILSALRGLCVRIALKGETQQVDRMLDAFSKRWCECNGRHGFKSSDVVHTICYSILLLNTDLHLVEIGHKMTRSQFIRNTMPTIRQSALDSSVAASPMSRAGTWPRMEVASGEQAPPLPLSPTSPTEPQSRRSSVDEAVQSFGSVRFSEKIIREHSGDLVHAGSNDPEPLVSAPFVGSNRAWESQVEQVLKQFYSAIARDRLPLFGARSVTLEIPQAGSNLLSITGNLLRRSPSTLSKAASDHSRGRGADNRLVTGRWAPSKTRSRSQFHAVSSHGSTRTSMDEGSSAWSPSISSTWSRASGGRTLTSISVDSVGSGGTRDGFQKSIGFANALSQAIIREDSSGIFSSNDGGIKVAPLLEDESLELSGAPWAKEGSLKHKHHLDGVNKRAKDRNWSECFAVIEKGWMRLFSFSLNAKSLRVKAKDRAKAGNVLGGGNWMDNAEEVCKLLLHHAIASALPQPGYSRARPFVWALSLPTGAVHLFQVGTAGIVEEFVSTANYWSARLSKEPMPGGISNMEYGWSDQIINRALVNSESQPSMPTSGAGRPSTQSSVRGSLDHRGGLRSKVSGDKVVIQEWCAPQQSMMASQLMEVDQLRALQAYVKNVEVELARHNELRPAMQLAFSSRHANTTKAMANWEHKSSYLLREIVKFQTYVDSLLHAQSEKEKLSTTKAEAKKDP